MSDTWAVRDQRMWFTTGTICRSNSDDSPPAVEWNRRMCRLDQRGEAGDRQQDQPEQGGPTLLGRAEPVVREQHAGDEAGDEAAEVSLPAHARQHAEQDEQGRVCCPANGGCGRNRSPPEVTAVKKHERREPADQSARVPRTIRR